MSHVVVLVTGAGTSADDAASPEEAGSRLSFPDGHGTDVVVVGEFNREVLVLGDDVTPSLGQQEPASQRDV